MSGTADKLNGGIFNNYTVMPKNLTMYTAYRGVTDFTQIGQFNQFESGYNFLSVISMPKFIEVAAQEDPNIAKIAFSFKHMLEYEFRGLSGLPSIEGQVGTITDGINEAQYINQVRMDTSVQVSMEYFEKTGSLITKFSEYYLTGIKDRISQGKNYHGMIRRGKIEPGLENEVFTLLYYVTDNTYLRLERAVLLANAQLASANTSMYDGTKGDIGNVPTTLTFNCFPIMGEQVDKAAKALLEDITGVNVGTDKGAAKYREVKIEGAERGVEQFATQNKTIYTATIDSNSYLYGIMDNNSAARITPLVNAIKKVDEDKNMGNLTIEEWADLEENSSQSSSTVIGG